MSTPFPDTYEAAVAAAKNTGLVKPPTYGELCMLLAEMGKQNKELNYQTRVLQAMVGLANDVEHTFDSKITK